MDEKQRRYGERLSARRRLSSPLLAQMRARQAGSALGLDRLVMLASGATRVDQVVWAPAVSEI